MFIRNDYTTEAVDRKTGERTGKPKKVWALWLILLVEFLGTFACCHKGPQNNIVTNANEESD